MLTTTSSRPNRATAASTAAATAFWSVTSRSTVSSSSPAEGSWVRMPSACLAVATIAAETVAILRLEAGHYPNDRQLADLVGELTVKSPEFTAWWADHRVLRRTHGEKHYHHPLVGDLHFQYQSFLAPGDTDQSLCVYNVEPGSATAQAMEVLGSWTAPQPEDDAQSDRSAR
jgi:hypothetical protein